jgi:two-component system nitrate/nitrite response regulator NarL
VAVLDMRIPGLDGLEVCARVAALEPVPPTRILVLSAFDEPDLVWQAVSSGAAGYLDKQAPHAEICAAIEAVARDRIAFTARTARGVDRGFAALYR